MWQIQKYMSIPTTKTKTLRKRKIAGLLMMLLCVFAQCVTAQINYVRSWTITAPDPDPNAVILRPVTEARPMSNFYDGLGRPVQTVVRQGSLATASGVAADLVSMNGFDDVARPNSQFLPFPAATTDGTYKTDAFTAQVNFYNSGSSPVAGQGESGANAHTQTNFEYTPLDRPLVKMAAGNNWVGAGRGVQMGYYANTVTDAVPIWQVTDNGMGNFGTYSTTTSYPAGTLYKTITADENGNQTIEFKDNEGKIVLKKVEMTATDNGSGSGYSGWLTTCYIYDNLSNLRCVVQPSGVAALAGNGWVLNATLLAEQCFRYEYDQRNRMILKQVPGAGGVYIVYDVVDRPVMTQDANLRSQGKWLATLYDGLNRPVMTALISDASSWSQMQSQVTAQTATTSGSNLTVAGQSVPTTPAAITLSSAESGDWRATQVITLQNGFSTAEGAFFSAEIVAGSSGVSSNNAVAIANNPIPAGDVPDILTVTYYDNYNWVGSSGLSASYQAPPTAGFVTSYNTSPQYAQPMIASSQTAGLATGTMVRILGTANQYLYSVSFFDDYHRTIQTQLVNFTGGTDIQTTQFDFSGKPLRALLQHQKMGATIENHQVMTKLDYDAEQRPVNTWKNIDGAATDQIVASHQYDALGQLSTKQLGKDPVSGSSLDNLVYTYNIRGWIQGINKAFAGGSGNNYFGMELGYDNATSVSGNSYLQASYNGNVAGTVWRSAGDGVIRKYDFTYDAASRLTGAAYLDNQSGWGRGAMDYTVENLTYDANGNIQTMNQHGFKIGNPTGLIDQLTYTYQSGGVSNKLSQVVDVANDAGSALGDFHYSGTKQATDYAYDGNGNLTMDNNKGIDVISYNYMNLPSQVHFPAKGSIVYTYDAAGNKLQKQVLDNVAGTATTTLYMAGGIQYQERSPIANPGSGLDTLQFISHEEGRARWAFRKYFAGGSGYDWEYDFYEKDHLGNTRVLLTQEVDTTHYVATMEAANRSTEDALFYGIESSCVARSSAPGYPNDLSVTNPNDSVVRVNGNGPKTGPAIILKVMMGDKVDVGAQYYYNSMTNSNPAGLNPADLLNSLATGLGAISGVAHASLSTLSNPTGSPLLGALTSSIANQTGTGTTKPQAYLNWVLLDDQFHYVGGNNQSGALQVVSPGTQSGGQLQLPLSYNGISIGKSGYLYIYVSNATPGWDVYFDNLSVTMHSGPMLEENHYYPFGLTMAGISDKALKSNYAENKYRYNGIEYDSAFGMDEYEARYRDLDPQIGRWWQIDPESEKQRESLSPYAAMSDDPVFKTDPLGNEDDPCCKVLRVAVAVTRDAVIFTASALNALGTNAVAGVGRADPSTMSGLTDHDRQVAQWGQTTGDALAATAGLVETGIGGGVTLASGGGAAPVGVPLAAHGIMTTGFGLSNLSKDFQKLNSAGSEEGGSRGPDKLEPDKEKAQGDHSTFERDNNGDIYKYQEWHVNPLNPHGFDDGKFFDGGKPNGEPGSPHFDKQTNTYVPTPHVYNNSKSTTPATPSQLPDNNRFKKPN
jgi:RHS repeat-associated protein